MKIKITIDVAQALQLKRGTPIHLEDQEDRVYAILIPLIIPACTWETMTDGGPVRVPQGHALKRPYQNEGAELVVDATSVLEIALKIARVHSDENGWHAFIPTDMGTLNIDFKTSGAVQISLLGPVNESVVIPHAEAEEAWLEFLCALSESARTELIRNLVLLYGKHQLQELETAHRRTDDNE